MTLRYDFVGVGGLAYDLVLRVESLPIADEKYMARLIGKFPGGFIANATCAAAHLGLRTGYAGWVGADTEGDMLHNDFVQRGVDPAGLVHVAGHSTPFTVVLSEPGGQRAILIPHSPLFELPLTNPQLALVEQARAVLTFPRDLEWFSKLRRYTLQGGGIIALDIENTVPMQGHALRQAIRLSEIVFLKHSSLPEIGIYALPDLVSPGQWLTLSSGSSGVYGIAHGMLSPVFQPVLPVDAVDTTGAGDCFHAALITARLEGATLVEGLRFATAAAALKVQHRGPRTGLPTRAEVEAMLA
ncbi:MAG: carbohydrate kinase family protein [Chloroflexi bacterium]|nr:carbohydrate kinase family protein [Chloroflexota bacterium]